MFMDKKIGEESIVPFHYSDYQCIRMGIIMLKPFISGEYHWKWLVLLDFFTYCKGGNFNIHIWA